MPITPRDLNDLRRIVEDHNAALAIRVFGPAALGISPEEVTRLVESGVLEASAVAPSGLVGTLDVIKDAHLLGMLRAQVQATTGKALAPLSHAELMVAMGHQPLSTLANRTIEAARESAGQYVTALGRRLADEIAGNFAAEDAAIRGERLGIIRDEVAEGLARKEGARRIASRLRERLEDYGRDWLRTAKTESRNAIEYGAAQAIRDDFGTDARVAKIPNPDACNRCRQLYLGDDGKPRVWRLSQLAANGSNVGRKSAQWLATLGTIHPFCECATVYVPDNMEFSDEEHGWELRFAEEPSSPPEVTAQEEHPAVAALPEPSLTPEEE